MPETQIAQFEVGRPTEGVFAVVRKTRLRSRNGDPYLALDLSDETGTISARVWENAEHFDRQIQTGDRVRAVGKPTRFRDEVQFDVRRIDRVDAPDVSFVPMATRSLDELEGELDFLIDEIETPDLRALAESVWRGPDAARLRRSPATVSDHHAYVGGLVEHSVGVASVAMAAVERHSGVDRDLVLCAALLHDVGRAREIEVSDAIGADELGSLEGHLLLGHEILLEACARLGSKPAQWSHLLHALLTHHGPIDRCRTREAAALVAANTLDARLAGAGRR